MSEPRRGNAYWTFNPDARRGAGEFRYNWQAILPEAATLVRSYRREGSDEATVTLRQLFYRLVASERLPNTQQAYGSLSSMTAEARRGDSRHFHGVFPGLMDRGRDIDRPHQWETAEEAATWLGERFMVDRSSNQPVNLYVVVEKNALRGQLFQWFAPMGLPVIALGGYPSQTLADQVYEDAHERGRGRPNVCIYAGDFDADGQDIARDFEERASCFDEVVHCALTPEQIEQFALPPQPGKWASARARGFAEKYADLFESVYGYDLVQIELDALPPEELRRIYTEAIDVHFDYPAYDERVAHEKREQRKVDALAEGRYDDLVELIREEDEDADE
jgi:hypothetical protein